MHAAARSLRKDTLSYRICRSVMAMDYFFHLAPQKKLIYIEVPKAGCTTVKNLLSRSLFGPRPGDPSDCHDRSRSGLLAPSTVGVERFEALIQDPETLVFTVVRNPFARLRSCYLDKFRGVSLSEPWMRHLIGDASLPGRDVAADRLSFDSFVRCACATAATTRNGHWAPMDRIVPRDIQVEIVRLEDLRNGLEPVLDRLDASDEIRALVKPHNATTPDSEVTWTEPLMAAVRRAYADDFRRFGYDPGHDTRHPGAIAA